MPDATPTVSLVPLPARPLAPGEAWNEELVTRAFMLWAGCRNAEATARLLENELREAGHEGPTPSARTIRHWTEYHGWRREADTHWREHKARDLFEVQAQAVAAVRLGLTNLLLVSAGAFDHDPMVGALRLKAVELAARLFERGVVPSLAIEPPTETVDTSHLSPEEQDAYNRALLNPRRKAR